MRALGDMATQLQLQHTHARTSVYWDEDDEKEAVEEEAKKRAAAIAAAPPPPRPAPDEIEGVAYAFSSLGIHNQLAHSRPTKIYSVKCRSLCRPLPRLNPLAAMTVACHVECASVQCPELALRVPPNSWSLAERRAAVVASEGRSLASATTFEQKAPRECDEVVESTGMVAGSTVDDAVHEPGACWGTMELPIGMRSSKQGTQYVYPTTGLWVFTPKVSTDLVVGIDFEGFSRTNITTALEHLQPLCDRFNALFNIGTRSKTRSRSETMPLAAAAVASATAAKRPKTTSSPPVPSPPPPPPLPSPPRAAADGGFHDSYGF
jgi:hypothetical protein